MSKQTIGSVRFIVARKAVLMEDEGRVTFIKSFTSRMKAKEWIANQKGEYFGPDDYTLYEESI